MAAATAANRCQAVALLLSEGAAEAETSTTPLGRYTGWASREVVWMFAGGFANQFFELDPEIWYGHSLGYNKKLSLRSPRVFFFFRELRALY